MCTRYTKDVKEAAEIIKSEGVIAYPTETVYGLGALALNELAIKKVIALKGMRPKPISLAVSHFNMINAVAFIDDPAVLRDLLPGPITVVLRKREIVPDLLTAGSKLVGIRYPTHKVAQSLISLVGAPVTSTSANITALQAPMNAQSVNLEVDCVLDGGASIFGPSTVVDLVNKKVVRRGAGYDVVVEKTGIL